MASRFGFAEMLQKMDALKRDLPPIIGNMGTRFFVESFTKQGFTDTSFEAWQKPQRMIPGMPAYKYPLKKVLNRRSRNILVGKSGGTKSGAHTHLKQSVNTSLKSASWSNILWAVPQPYARRHNEGLDYMPKRKFIGYSYTLMKQIEEKVNSEMIKILG